MTPVVEHGKRLTILITIDDKTVELVDVMFYDVKQGFIQTQTALYMPKELDAN